MPRMDLSSIAVNYATRPPRVVVYGDHGIGKTTFATSAPAPIVIRTEDGLAAIQVPAFPLAERYADVIDAIDTLYRGGHPFQTVVLDSLDWLEPLVWQHTAESEGKHSIEDFGFGKGFTMADEHWRVILNGLDALNANGMTVICLAHAEIRRFDAPDTEAYDRYQIKLHKRAAGIVQEWADVIGFAHHEVMTVSQDVGFNKKATRGVSVGTRVLAVEERPAYYAKNRYALPPSIPFPKVGAWEAFATACAPAFAQPEPAPLHLAPPTIPAPTLDEQKRLDAMDRLFGDELAEIRGSAAEPHPFETPFDEDGTGAEDLRASTTL